MTALPYLVPDLPVTDELLPWLRRIDDIGIYTNAGPLHAAFKAGLANQFFPHYHAGHLALTSSGTSALELALQTLDAPAGSHVLTPAFTFPATALAIQRAGLTPLFCDIDATTLAMSPTIAREAANHARSQGLTLAALMPVAAYGMPLEANSWATLSHDLNLPLVVDAAAALGQQSSTAGGTYCFSLHATKPFGIGEGGLVVSDDPAHTARIEQYSNFGLHDERSIYPGTNAKLSEYHCAVGLAQLQRWPAVLSRRQRLLAAYREYLSALPVQWQAGIDQAMPANLFIRTPLAGTEVAEELKRQGINTRRYYCQLLHQQPAFEPAEVASALEVSEAAAHSGLALPFYGSLGEHDVRRICRVLEGCL